MAQSKKTLSVKSPCINVCALNLNNVCEGCYRSVDEIARWAGMEDDERQRVLERCWQRAKTSGRTL